MDSLDRQILDRFQRGLPLVPRPYAAMAEALGCGEAELLERLARLRASGMVARVGATFRPNRVGASTLAALAVPPERLEAVAAIVSGFDEVNHNYQRDHRLNLWFVVTAHDRGHLRAVLDAIADACGLAVLDFPLVDGFHIDLGFPLWST
ncbi:AsnC family transcriptional regulator [Azospirillum sp. ST 5-10]|uniref:AsnC family transcriptional regulator n=1 Tax=unclassified Azospirillum TaxID=2630922 RepID=UPI003F4A82E5